VANDYFKSKETMMAIDNNQPLIRDEIGVDDYTSQANGDATATIRNNGLSKILIGALIGGSLGAIATALTNKDTATRINKTVKNVGNAVKRASASVNDTVKDVGDAVKNVAGNVNETVQDVRDSFIDAYEGVNDTITSTVTAVKGTADHVNNAVKTTADVVKSGTGTMNPLGEGGAKPSASSPYQMAYIVPVENMGNIPPATRGTSATSGETPVS
jgi:gas vesicle protein